MAASRFQIPSLLLALALGAGGPLPALAADPPPAEAKAGAEAGAEAADLSKLRQATAEDLQMETTALLAGVPENLVQDAVWKYVPNRASKNGAPARMNRIAVVPVVVGKGAYKAGDPPVGFGEGRFVAWYIPVPEAKAKDKAAAATLPLGAPRVASSFAVTADGRIHWSTERFASTMDLTSGGSLGDERSFYLFSFDRQRLKALVPQPYKKGPAFVRPAKDKTETNEAYRMKEAQAKAEYDRREAEARQTAEARREQYAQAFDTVGGLPDKFSAPAPELVYAVYYVPVPPPPRPAETTFVGHPQGAWKPTPAAWAALTTLAKGAQTGSPEARKAVEAQLKLVAADLEAGKGHPLALRAAAAMLASSGLMNDLSADDTAYAIADQVLGGKDAEARGRLMRALVASSNSAAKAKLLARAVTVSEAIGDRAMSDQLRISALRVLLRSKETDTDVKRVDAVNKALAEAGGAPPKDLLEELFVLFRDGGLKNLGVPIGEMTPERAKVMAAQFRFQDIADPKRRVAAMTAMADRCPESILATLAVDDNMLAAGSAVAPLDALAAVAAAAPGVVPLHRAQHGFIAKLTDQDGAVREAAWRALPAFRVRSISALDKEKNGLAALSAMVAGIVDAGLAAKPVPAELAIFLAAHGEAEVPVRNAAVIGLARELGAGGDAGRRQALEAMSTPVLAPLFAPALEALNDEGRFKAVAGCYAAKGQAVPLPVGLLLSEKESLRVAQWFATEMAKKGKLPLPADYAGQMQDQAKLMDWVMAQEPRLARAAVALLVYHEGGDDAQAAAMADKMLAEPYKLRAQMERKWEACRNEIFMARVKSATGEREVRLAAFRKGTKEWRAGEARPVTLKCDDTTVATGVPGVAFQADAGKKVLALSDLALLDRVNPKMRHELELGALAGPVELTWVAPCWEARVRPDADTEVLLRVAPVGWKQMPDAPNFEAK